jgi:glycosyltransferase involved in cell wall biosynthesis
MATLDRVKELDRLLCSLDRQTCDDFEVIIVDQNPDDRLVPVIATHPHLQIKHLHSPKGLSKARNVGLRSASGDLIAIPDDDCWYPEQLLAQVNDWFTNHAHYAALSTSVRSEDGVAIGPNWPRGACDCTKSNIFRSVVSCSIFFRREVVKAVGDFDEGIGVGAASKLQSGEETDYVLRALNLGFRHRFEPALVVHHPKLHSLQRLRRITFSYALGTGYLLRAHNFPARIVASYLIRSCGGAVVNLLQGRVGYARVYALRAAGQLVGYLHTQLHVHTQIQSDATS